MVLNGSDPLTDAVAVVLVGDGHDPPGDSLQVGAARPHIPLGTAPLCSQGLVVDRMSVEPMPTSHDDRVSSL